MRILKTESSFVRCVQIDAEGALGPLLIEINAVQPEDRRTANEAVRVESESSIRSRFESYLSDESGLGPGNAQLVFFPVTEKQVAGFLREMNARKTSVTISGARTSIVGGAVPNGGALMSLERMNRIVGVKWDEPTREWRILVEPGISLREFQGIVTSKNLRNYADPSDPGWAGLQRFLSEGNQYFYPPDPTEDSASLGGTVATDASGARTYFFGRTRSYVRAIRVAFATSDVLAIRRGVKLDSSGSVTIKCLEGGSRTLHIPSYKYPDVKCAAGYFNQKNMDLIGLFIGSEGTLGVITQIEVALVVAPKRTAFFLAFFPCEDDAVNFVLRIRSRRFAKGPLVVYSMEYFDSNSLNLLRRLMQEDGVGTGVRLPEDDSATAILCEFAYQEAAEAVGLLQGPLEESRSSLDTAVSGMEEREKDNLRALRHAVPEAINKIVAKRKGGILGMHKIGTDTAVPDDKLQTMMRDYSQKLKASHLEHYVFGHIAENHLHVNILPRNQVELVQGEALALELTKRL
jgi:D-lactate dehydrogenase (cytochrome)